MNNTVSCCNTCKLIILLYNFPSTWLKWLWFWLYDLSQRTDEFGYSASVSSPRSKFPVYFLLCVCLSLFLSWFLGFCFSFSNLGTELKTCYMLGCCFMTELHTQTLFLFYVELFSRFPSSIIQFGWCFNTRPHLLILQTLLMYRKVLLEF